MPTIARIGPYRVFFYSNEGSEPPHVHVQRDDALAKFWLVPVALEYSQGFNTHELTKLEGYTTENQQEWLKAWHEHFRTVPPSY
jgi:hypothetical protein